jgi:hypothetical protein
MTAEDNLMYCTYVDTVQTGSHGITWNRPTWQFFGLMMFPHSRLLPANKLYIRVSPSCILHIWMAFSLVSHSFFSCTRLQGKY